MTGRKKAFELGLSTIHTQSVRKLINKRRRICAIRPSLYNARGMPDLNQMPIGVLNRIIKASSNPGEVVLDPFNGSGTTVVAAALLDRKYVGIDQSAEYVGYAKKRLEHALQNAGAGNNATDARSVVLDAKRASKVMTKTDAFGRPRVARRSRAAKSA